MKATGNNLSVLLKIQLASALFIVFLIIQSLFIGEISNLFGTILGGIQELLTIPAIIFTIVCFVIAVVQVLFKKNYSKQSKWLLAISSFCIVLMIVATINEM